MKEEILLQELKNKYPEIENRILEAKILNILPEEYFFAKGLISAEEILGLKSKIYNLPIKKFEEEEKIPKEVLEKIPENVAKNYRILPLEFKNNILYLGVFDPEVPHLKEKVIEPLKMKYKSDVQLLFNFY